MNPVVKALLLFAGAAACLGLGLWIDRLPDVAEIDGPVKFFLGAVAAALLFSSARTFIKR